MKDYTSETAKLLKLLKHIVIAVVDEDNKPWAVPVGLKKVEGLVIEWDSHMKTRHSLAIDLNPQIAITGSDWMEVGVYMQAVVEAVEPIKGEFARYKARITAVWYNDSERIKRVVDIEKLAQILT